MQEKSQKKLIILLLLILIILSIIAYYNEHPRAKIFLKAENYLAKIQTNFLKLKITVNETVTDIKTTYYYEKIIKPKLYQSKTFYNSGTLALFSGDLHKAINYFHQSLELDSGFINTYINLALAYKGLGNLTGTLQTYLSGYQISSGNTEILKGLASTYFLLQDRKNSAKFYKQLIFSGNILTNEIAINYGYSLFKLGKIDETINFRKNAINSGINSAEINYNLAELLFGQKNYKQSLKYYKNAFNLGQNDEEIIYKIGRINYQLGNYQQAIDFLEKIWEKNPQAQKILGIIYFKQKNRTKAKKYFYYYLKENPQEGEIRNYLGECYFNLGSYLQAEVAYKKAYNILKTDEIKANIFKAQAKLNK